MKFNGIRGFLEGLSFILWIVFTILSISLAGLGLEAIAFAAVLLMVSSTQPIHIPLDTTILGGLGVFLSISWRRYGVDHLHYLQYDSPKIMAEDSEAPSAVLQGLIDEVESSSGYDRNDARTKAKTWLIAHASSLDEEDILLARNHFSYLLPAGWGGEVTEKNS